MRSELTNNEFTRTGPRSLPANKRGHITRTKPAGISSAVAVLATYASEIYPTRVRSRGVGLAAGMTKAGGVVIIAPIVAASTTPSIAATALIGAMPLSAMAAEQV